MRIEIQYLRRRKKTSRLLEAYFHHPVLKRNVTRSTGIPVEKEALAREFSDALKVFLKDKSWWSITRKQDAEKIHPGAAYAFYHPMELDPKDREVAEKYFKHLYENDSNHRSRILEGRCEALEKENKRLKDQLVEEIGPLEPIPWDDAVEGVLLQLRTNGGAKGNPASKEHVENRVRQLSWWNAQLKLDDLGKLTKPMVQKIVAGLVQEGKLANQTINLHIDAIRAMTSWARDNDLLKADPLERFKRLPKIPKVERRALTDEEFSALLEAAPKRKTLYLLAATSGLRARELSKATLVPEGLCLRSKDEKNRKGSVVPLPAWLLSLLKRRLARPSTHPDRDFRNDLVKAEIKDTTGLVFHSLRHTTATVAHRAGVAPLQVMRHMRHSTMDMTMGYSHSTTREQKAAAERIGRVVRKAARTGRRSRKGDI